MASFKDTCLFVPCTGNIKISLIWISQCINIFFCTHVWGFICTMGVHLTCDSEPLPWNKVCVLSHATFLWINSSYSFGKFTFIIAEYAVVHLVEALHYKPEGRRFDSRWGSLDYFIDLSFQLHYGPRVALTLHRNEYWRYLLWVKAASA